MVDLKRSIRPLKHDAGKWYDQNMKTIQQNKRLSDKLKKHKTKDKGPSTSIVP
jgi:hypothetical protein